jgi:WD40 repeat protein
LLRTFDGHGAAVTSVAFLADKQRLASATNDGTLRFWDANSGELSHTWKGHDGAINCISFAPRGECFASGGVDNRVRLWNPVTGEAIANLPSHSGVNRLTFSRDGKLLACGGADGRVQVWQVAEIVEMGAAARALHTFQGHTDAVTGLGFSSDGKRLVSGSADRSVKIWDVIAGDELISFRSGMDAGPRVQFSPDGRFLAATRDFCIVVWDSQSTMTK